jgi:hypothetical protein
VAFTAAFLRREPKDFSVILIADAGLPMIAWYLPRMWLALVPVILLEAAIGMRITGLSFRRAAWAATAANCFSTLIGVPLAWIVLATVELIGFGSAEGLDSFGSRVYAVTVQSPWLIPYEKDLWWMVPIAAVCLAVPFWSISVVSEYAVVRRLAPDASAAALWRWMWIGNLASYLALPLMAWIIASALPRAWTSAVTGPVVDFFADVVFRLAAFLRGH